MMTRRKQNLFSVPAVFLILCFCLAALLSLPVSAEGENTVRVETGADFSQGASGYGTVYIDSLAGIASLDVTVHFDPDVVEITGTYNSVSASMYDSSVGDDGVRYTYIFDGNGPENKTGLFYFYYTIKDTAALGKTRFDVTVSDAYGIDLLPLTVNGSRTAVTVSEKKVSKTASLYRSSNVSTSVQNEFDLSYSVSTYQIASGSFAIRYDDELFELVSITPGGLLSGKISDINTDLAGSVYVSFVSNEYSSYNDLISVRLRTKKNVSQSSEIKLEVTDFYDLTLCPIVCQPVTTTVTVVHDDSIFDDAPGMVASSELNDGETECTVLITLDADSHLGAGDFTFTFDPARLTYVSAEKLFSPTFFTVNDKSADDGIIKFSVISTADIVKKTSVLKLTFSVKRPECDSEADISLAGSTTTDSMTNPIRLNYAAKAIAISGKVEDPPEVTMPTVSGRHGQTVEVPICLQHNSGVSAMTFTVNYGAGITLENVTFNESLGGQTALSATLASPATVQWINTSEKWSEDGVFATLKFRISDDAAYYSDIDITLDYSPENIYVSDGSEKRSVSLSVTNGKISVLPVAGDINGDGSLSSKDITRLFQYQANWLVSVNEYALDVNGDGCIDSKDVTRLFQYMANWDVEIFVAPDPRGN
ncbi:MAG: hypothetical protein KBS76_05275 [Ruminococcus sp.]|nr:hypothetical protein [Candidatus Apopatosoma intestinale]